MHTGLSSFITLNQNFLTCYKQIQVLSTLCYFTLKNKEKPDEEDSKL